jgi:hypothetical protein
VIPRELDSLEVVDKVMAFEEILEIFGSNAFEDSAHPFNSERELVDHLELRVGYRRPGQKAATLLRKLAKAQRNPELAEGLDGTWRREQIADIIREIFL